MEIDNTKEKTSYLLITENDKPGIFICISELDILNRGKVVPDVVFAKYIEKENQGFIYLFANSGVVLDIEIMYEEKEIIKEAIEVEEIALMIMSLESKVLLALDIE